ncbi:U32 family peptidase [Candidatus Parabeggiatoa sp. HSG14]|uniref:ubiquinone anaerobic biosynthesis protein UbiV n=1 Tax=Candidatus Parabeggiatoa sp. HSG14 TaxID=3055593 RepID=UPI0025A7A866|nr:U32 family peptidase [Thiotrichales bacterium HSG14]
MNNTQPKLSLGPVLYYWSRDTLFDFYEQMIETPVDIIYLGETICSKRKSLRTSDWLTLAKKLAEAGKEVVLSTLALLEAESELKTLRRLCENGQFMVEANDMAAVNLLEGNSFVTGTSVNLYNTRALTQLAKLGLRRWVLPVELSRDTLADMQATLPEGVETEVLVYGRLPLAYSARCFTARAHNLPKDDCQYRCLDYPDGLTLSSQDKKPFLSLNGIQTQSACFYNLLPALDDIKSMNVDVLRISPQSRHTEKIVEIFHRCLQEPGNLAEDTVRLQRLMPMESCDGYWYGQAGMAEQAKAAISELG